MILLNFSHPITPEQQARIETLAQQAITRTISALPQFDEQLPFAQQLAPLLAQVNLSPIEWQNEAILVILPSLNFIAALLLAELHGRMGYFPAVVRTRPVNNSLPRQYEIAEILNLQTVREEARKQR